MAKRKRYRFRCPICGLLVWENRLKNDYELEVVDVYSSGRGLIKNIFLPWSAGHSLCSVFKSHFYDVLTYMLQKRYINADAVKNIADVYGAKKERSLFPISVHEPTVVHHPSVVHHPKVVKNEIWR